MLRRQVCEYPAGKPYRSQLTERQRMGRCLHKDILRSGIGKRTESRVKHCRVRCSQPSGKCTHRAAGIPGGLKDRVEKRNNGGFSVRTGHGKDLHVLPRVTEEARGYDSLRLPRVGINRKRNSGGCQLFLRLRVRLRDNKCRRTARCGFIDERMTVAVHSVDADEKTSRRGFFRIGGYPSDIRVGREGQLCFF